MVIKIVYITGILLLINHLVFGQAVVEKQYREDNKAYFKVRYYKDLDSVVFNFSEGYKNKLKDAEKLQLIACLLTFEGDTTQHPGMVHPVYFGSSERNIRFTPKSKYFTIEICALYFIDRIAYGTDTDYYSPAPVLFDTEEKVEINDDPEKVKVVFEAYRKWFSECIERGKIPKYFPFNDGRYVWYYGKKSLHPKVDPRNPFR